MIRLGHALSQASGDDWIPRHLQAQMEHGKAPLSTSSAFSCRQHRKQSSYPCRLLKMKGPMTLLIEIKKNGKPTEGFTEDIKG